MLLHQFYLGCLAHASYLIGDEQSGAAAVVDPQRDVDQYVASRASMACRSATSCSRTSTPTSSPVISSCTSRQVRRFISGGRRRPSTPFTPLGDGDRIELGDVRLEALETPGHTPESISILAYDRAVSDAVPHAVLTGDTLFVGDVGRPDLRAALGWSANDLGGLLYDWRSTRSCWCPIRAWCIPRTARLVVREGALEGDRVDDRRTAPDELRPRPIDPGGIHGAGDPTDEPDAPSYFTYDAVLNSRKRQTLTEALSGGTARLMPLGDCLELQRHGIQLLDTRDASEFAAAHLKGSINVGLAARTRRGPGASF